MKIVFVDVEECKTYVDEFLVPQIYAARGKFMYADPNTIVNIV